MDVLIVRFQLDGISEADYYRGCDADAPRFAAIPGLISKVWLADAATNTYGGIYTFVDRECLEAYLDSALFRAVAETPGFTNMTVRDFSVLEGPTAITRGIVATGV